MPLFGNKFSPKKPPPRKYPSMSNLNLDATERREEFGIDFGPVKMKLGSQEMIFSDGQWIAESGVVGGGGGGNMKEVVHLRKQNMKLQEENNLLKYKVDILLDMLSERTAETHLQDNQIEQLKKQIKKR